MVSDAANRGEGIPLADAVLSGFVYIYLEGVDAERVEFYLDDAEHTQGPVKVAVNAPFDFAGGEAAQAAAFDTASLANGPHLLSAVLFLEGGERLVLEAPFTVQNETGISAQSVTTKTISVRVGSSADDAEEDDDGRVLLKSSDLEMTYNYGDYQSVGVRFGGLDIPQGAVVTEAYIQFTADERNSDRSLLNIYGHNTDNAPSFEARAKNVTGRDRTGASISWSPSAWNEIGEAGSSQRTSNLAPIIQEIVSRSGWRSGNALAFVVEGKGAHTAVSFDSSSTKAPRLLISYTTEGSAPVESSPAPEIAAPNIYVSTSGSDGGDGSLSKPYRSIVKALSVVRPGDTIQLRGGVYREYVPSTAFVRSGSSSAPITIESYPGEKAIFDGSSRHWSDSSSITNPSLFKVKGVAYYVIRNLTFRNSAGRALNIDGNRHRIEGIISYGNHSDGVYVLGDNNVLDGIVSYDNYSEQNGGNSADGIKISYGRGNVIRNCKVYDNSDDGIDIIYTEDTLIEHCVAFENGRGSSGNGNGYKLGSNSGGDTGNTIRYSVAYKNRQNNFTSNGGGGITFYNNTSWYAGRNGFVIKSYGADNVARNNIAYRGGISVGSNNVHDHNSWNLNIGDPKFRSLDPKSSDFLKLASDSPAIDAGKNVGLSYKGSAPDLGAFER